MLMNFRFALLVLIEGIRPLFFILYEMHFALPRLTA